MVESKKWTWKHTTELRITAVRRMVKTTSTSEWSGGVVNPLKQGKAACTRSLRSLFSSAIEYKRSRVPRNPEQTTDPTREKQPGSVCVRVDGHVLALTCRAASRKRLFWSSAAPRQAPPHAIMTTSPFHKEMCLERTPRWHPANYRLRIIFSLQNIEIEHRASSRSLGCIVRNAKGGAFLGSALNLFL